MTFNFLGPGLTVNVEAKVKEQIILDSSGSKYNDWSDGLRSMAWKPGLRYSSYHSHSRNRSLRF